MPRIFMCLHSTFQVNFLLASNLQHTHTQNEPTVSKNCRSVFLNFLLYMLLKIHNKSLIFAEKAEKEKFRDCCWQKRTNQHLEASSKTRA